MRIDYVCHSCLHIDTGDTSMVFDPWFKGPAYKNQWQLFPKPVNTGLLSNVKNILFSHGHDDHLHMESLQQLPHTAKVFYPFQWSNSCKSFFAAQGFNKVTEAVSFTKYQISPTTTVTYVGFALESIMVIEQNGFVLVNLNDALNSHHQMVVDIFLREIKKRWPNIDLLFSGWSGAGYFPNTVHYKGKNDHETGKIREQYFANHFCKIIQQLQPKAAIPFAPGFVLLKADKRWINGVKFKRGGLEKYYRENFDTHTNIRFHVMYPGDYFENSRFFEASPYYKDIKNGTLDHTIDEVFRQEIQEANAVKWVTEEQINALLPKLNYWLNENRSIYPKTVLKAACFSISLEDYAVETFINVQYSNEQFIATLNNKPSPKHKLLIKTTSELLHHSLDHEWGGDALTIGYGLDVYVQEELTLEQNLDLVCVRLITRYPRASSQLLRNPFRALKYYWNNPMLGKLAIKKKLLLKSAVNKFPYNERDHWVSYTKCDLCQVCNMPLLSYDFGEKLMA